MIVTDIQTKQFIPTATLFILQVFCADLYIKLRGQKSREKGEKDKEIETTKEAAFIWNWRHIDKKKVGKQES